MRSVEIAADGGCMLTEDTAEHREILGPDGKGVVYFSTASEAADRVRWPLADPTQRTRLFAVLRARSLHGAHTFRDRLISVLEGATQIRRAYGEPRQSAGR
jgi:hypothetical protein